MQLCDTDKGISCYSFLAAAIVQLIITIYFSILCVKAMQIYNLTSQKYPLITKIHLLKLITLFSIIGVEVAGLSLAFERSQSESIDASELFNSIVSIISEFICIFLLRKEFLVLKLTSGYLRSYISLSFFIYTVVLMVNAFNNKQNTFGLSPDQIVYILCLVLKFVLSAEVFIFKSDIIKSQKYEQDEYDYNYTQEELNENDDLYFHLQNQHMEIDTDKNVNKQSGCDFQIIYQEVVESRGSQVFHSKNHHTKQSFNQQNQFLNPQTFKGENSIKSNNQISQIRSTGKNNCQQDDIINPKYLNCKSQQNSQQKGSFQSSDQNLLQAMHNKSSITQNTNQKSFVQKYELEGRGNRSSQASNITETMQINHLFIKEIQNLNGTILIKIQITLMNGQEGELHKSLKEFQQIVTFIKNFFKQQDPDLIEIEQMNTNLKFHNTQDEEILMRKLEKIMNLIIINNFHTNSNISSFFKISDQIRSNSYNANCVIQLFFYLSIYLFIKVKQHKKYLFLSNFNKIFGKFQLNQQILSKIFHDLKND